MTKCLFLSLQNLFVGVLSCVQFPLFVLTSYLGIGLQTDLSDFEASLKKRYSLGRSRELAEKLVLFNGKGLNLWILLES